MTEKDWLSNALAAREAYIDDDGFSDRVMACLLDVAPARTRRHDWIPLIAAAAASAVVALQFPFAPFVQVLTATLQTPVVMGVLMATAMAVGLGSDKLKELLPW